MKGIHLFIILLIVIYIIIYRLNFVSETFGGKRGGGGIGSDDENSIVNMQKSSNVDNSVIENPDYLKQPPSEKDLYEAGVINDQMHEIRRLRGQVQKMAEMIDEGNPYKIPKFYERKLSNKYYKVMPYMAVGVNDGTSLNLYDDDFSTKTLSTIKFLSQTRKSRFFGDEVHFPTELCGNSCPTSDINVAYHEQFDSTRPIIPPGFIPRQK